MSGEAREDSKTARHVKFLKPVAGFAYFPGDEGTVFLTEERLAALKKLGAVEEVEPPKSSKGAKR